MIKRVPQLLYKIPDGRAEQFRLCIISALLPDSYFALMKGVIVILAGADVVTTASFNSISADVCLF